MSRVVSRLPQVRVMLCSVDSKSKLFCLIASGVSVLSSVDIKCVSMPSVDSKCVLCCLRQVTIKSVPCLQ